MPATATDQIDELEVTTSRQALAALGKADARLVTLAGQVAASDDIDEDLATPTLSMIATARTLISRVIGILPADDVKLDPGTLAQVRTAFNQAARSADRAIDNLHDPGLVYWFLQGLRESVAAATSGLGSIAGAAGQAAGEVLKGLWPVLAVVGGALLVYLLISKGVA